MVTIQSFWKPEGIDLINISPVYLESSIGKIYSPCKYLFRNFSTGATITEEKLLATLASYKLKKYNEKLYSTLVQKVSTKSPEYIVDELLRFGETTEAIKTIYEEDLIFNAIKDDKVCQYLYFDEYFFRTCDYQTLKQSEDLEEKLFYHAAGNIKLTGQVNRYNYMGVPYYNDTQFLINALDKNKIKDDDIINYLIPNISNEIKSDPKLWLHLIACPKSFISITPEQFRIDHYEEYKKVYQKKKAKEKKLALERLYLCLSKENQEKYFELFTDLKITPLIKKTLASEKKNTTSNTKVISDFYILWDKWISTFEQETQKKLSQYKNNIIIIYNKYYHEYKNRLEELKNNKTMTEEEYKEQCSFNIFLKKILLNYKNFNIIYNEKEITNVSFYILIDIINKENKKLSKTIDLYLLTKRKEELSQYINIIINKEYNNIYSKNELLKELVLDNIINSRVLFSKEKEIIIDCIIDKENNYSVYNIKFLLEKQQETTTEIIKYLQENNETKPLYYDLYQDSLYETFNHINVKKRSK